VLLRKYHPPGYEQLNASQLEDGGKDSLLFLNHSSLTVSQNMWEEELMGK
jgi:hypothetical protein